MLKIWGDFETYYSKTYSLRVMTPIEYIKHPEYETLGCSVAVADKDPVWLEGDRVATLLRKVKEPYMFVSHNALFDAAILAYRYDIHPTLCVDTMAMARALLMPELSNGRVSLEALAKHLNLPPKGTEIHNMLGMRLADLKEKPGAYGRAQAYANHDTMLCREIYRQLSPRFPATEHLINDMVIKMATRPQFIADYGALLDHKHDIAVGKQMLLEKLKGMGVGKPELMSNDKLAEILTSLGVTPPTKPSPSNPDKTAYAFAKTDEEFNDLLEHEDPDVQAVVAARLGVKSTLEETRTNRFIAIADATYAGKVSYMPIPLRYGGAHTHRLSGDWKLNAQNLPSRKNKKLRESLAAPEGHEVLTVDAAQIEARLTAWLSKQADLVEVFRQSGDVYSLFASEIYGYEVRKKTHPTERFLGKVSILGLGFGMGAVKFHTTVQVQARDNDVTIDLPEADAARVVGLYRRKYANIKKTWDFLNHMIGEMYAGRADGVQFGPCVFEGTSIILPSGLRLSYNGLKYERSQWTYRYGREYKRLYGGKLLENVVQALDRVIVLEAALRVAARTRKEFGEPYRMAHQVHDENVYVPRLEHSAILRPILIEEMARAPVWGPDLPLAAEAGSGPNFGAAK